MNSSKYPIKNSPFDLKYLRKWPAKTLTTAPEFCSVDLRDGNQSIPVPMNFSQKLRMFNILKNIGFKRIELGYPSSSETEYNFIRHLIEHGLTEDITCAVLVPCIKSHIDIAVQCMDGNKNTIFHLYNSTSPIQRQYVFGKSAQETVDLAVQHVDYLSKKVGPSATLQYSPESFTATEPEFSAQICNAVIESWKGRIIINLPSTVELFSPNIFADYVEYMKNNLIGEYTLSVHPHNDRGTAVASAELAVLAGANIVEGTLFGNGERAGNCDILTLALNYHTSGIDCGLDFSDLDVIEEAYKECTGMTIHSRHPYAGGFYFTSFSGTHQDAINKTVNSNLDKWEIPYLPIDPVDLGRTINIRINAQSGKGGIDYILKTYYNIHLPKELLINFGKYVKSESDKTMLTEMNPDDIIKLLETFVDVNYVISAYQKRCCLNSNTLHVLTTNHNINIEEYIQYSLGQDSNSKALTIMKIDGIYYLCVADSVELSAITCAALSISENC
jgi:2-isopropylmalate synthase